MKHKILLRITLFRFGARRFEQELNDLLDQGWQLAEAAEDDVALSWEPVGWFRTLLFAHLVKADKPAIYQ